MQLIISGIEHTESNINISVDLVFLYVKYLWKGSRMSNSC